MATVKLVTVSPETYQELAGAQATPFDIMNRIQAHYRLTTEQRAEMICSVIRSDSFAHCQAITCQFTEEHRQAMLDGLRQVIQ